MQIEHNYHVYIVECTDKSYYTGLTNNIERRLQEHNDGINPNCFTYTRRPVTLKHYEHFTDIKQAIAREKQLKGWGRKKKEALFTNDLEELKRLAKEGYFDKLSMTENRKFYPSTSSG
jgi:putative endonuclease